MKTKFLFLIMAIVMVGLASCKQTPKEEPVLEPVSAPVVIEKPAIDKVINVNPASDKTYNYHFASFDANSVQVDVDRKAFQKPATVLYKAGKDTYKYILPKEFKVWKKPVIDGEHTVWICGWYRGMYKEYVFYGQKKYQGKITPNSFRGENGTIKYRN